MSHLGERLSAFVDGELGHAQRDRVLAHLATCELCRAEAAALRMLKRRLRAMGEATARAGLTDQLMALAAVGPPAAAHPGAGREAMESRWPLRSLALTALAVLALALPVAAFMAGGGRGAGPSVTPQAGAFAGQDSMFGAVLAPSPAPVRTISAAVRPPGRTDPVAPGQRRAARHSAARRPGRPPASARRPGTRALASQLLAVRHAVPPRAW